MTPDPTSFSSSRWSQGPVPWRDGRWSWKRFSDGQVIGILREAGAVATGRWRRGGLSSVPFHAWKARFGGTEGEPLSALGPRTMASDAKRERSRAEAMLDREADRIAVRGTGIPPGRPGGSAGERMATPAARRDAAAQLQTMPGMRQRRAGAVVGAERTRMRHRSCRAGDTGRRHGPASPAARAGRAGTTVGRSTTAHPAPPRRPDAEPRDDAAARPARRVSRGGARQGQTTGHRLPCPRAGVAGAGAGASASSTTSRRPAAARACSTSPAT